MSNKGSSVNVKFRVIYLGKHQDVSFSTICQRSENNYNDLAGTILQTSSQLKWSPYYRHTVGQRFPCCQQTTVLPDAIESSEQMLLQGQLILFTEKQNIKLLENSIPKQDAQ